MTHTDVYQINDLKDFKGWRLANPNAAKLLDTIIFRWRVCTIKVRGKPGPWAVYPRHEWCMHSGLSLDQYKRALRVLVADGLVLSERHRFGGSKVLAHLQPSSRALDYAGRPDDIKRLGAAYSPPGAPPAAPPNAPIDAPTDYTHTPKGTISTTDTTVCASYSEDAPSPPSGNLFSGEGEKKTAAGLPLPLKKPIAEVWQEAVEKSYPGTLLPLTPVQGKQLKDFVKACPPDYAGNILRHAIENWPLFIGYAKTHHAAFKVPDTPTTGFLLKFIQTAIFLWQQEYNLEWANGEFVSKGTVGPKIEAPGPSSVQTTPSTGKKAKSTPKKKKMSWEEVQAVMAEDNSEFHEKYPNLKPGSNNQS